MIRRRVVVHGDVQGVGFRWNARAEAERLGVTGWVRNRPDSAVEAEVEGTVDAVQRMLDWLSHGPRHARVDRIEVSEMPAEGSGSFEVRG